MISAFRGEFSFHPSALEYSGRTCSHNCCYCFANIRNKHIEAKFKETLSFFNNINKGYTVEKELFRAGYCICMSNRTDPLGDSNVEETMILSDMLRSVPNGIFWQTKGGKRQYELLDKLQPEKDYIYITITTPRDDKAKIIEPNAPKPSSRIEFAKECARRGFGVIVALNPFVEEWCNGDELLDMVDDLKKSGVSSFIFQPLHLSKNEIRGFEQWRVKAFDGLNLDQELTYEGGQSYVEEAVEVLREDKEIDIFAFGMPYKTNVFKKVRAKIGKCFPSNNDFLNYAIDTQKDEYTFEDYYNALTSHSGLKEFFETKEFSNISSYIFTVARNAWKGNPRAQSALTFKDVLRVFWEDKRVSVSPQNNSYFDDYEMLSDGTQKILKRKGGNDERT